MRQSTGRRNWALARHRCPTDGLTLDPCVADERVEGRRARRSAEQHEAIGSHSQAMVRAWAGARATRLIPQVLPRRAVPCPPIGEHLAVVKAAIDDDVASVEGADHPMVGSRRRTDVSHVAPFASVPLPRSRKQVRPSAPTEEEQLLADRVPRELDVIARIRWLGVDLAPLGHVPLPRLGDAVLLRQRDPAVSDENVAIGIPAEAGHDGRGRAIVRQQLPLVAIPRPDRLEAGEVELVDAVREDQPIERISPEQLRVEARRRMIHCGRARRRRWHRRRD